MAVEASYKTAQVATMIGVGASTMRKYALEVEAFGGVVSKDEKGDRIYTNTDIQAFKRLRQLVAQGDTVATASEKVALLMQGEQEAQRQAGYTLATSDRALMVDMMEEIKALRSEVSELKTDNIEMIDEFRALHNAEQVKARNTFMLALNEIKVAQDKSVDQKQIGADVSEGSELLKVDKQEDLTAALNEIKEKQKKLMEKSQELKSKSIFARLFGRK